MLKLCLNLKSGSKSKISLSHYNRGRYIFKLYVFNEIDYE